MDTKEKEHEIKHPEKEHEPKHAPVKADSHVVAEAEMKRKGLKPIGDEDSVFAPLTLEDQKYIHANSTDVWKKMNEDLRENKKAALDQAHKIDLEKQEAELKLLKVKRYDETLQKPDFLCVVRGCGEPKAPGQGYHCTAHSKGS